MTSITHGIEEVLKKHPAVFHPMTHVVLTSDRNVAKSSKMDSSAGAFAILFDPYLPPNTSYLLTRNLIPPSLLKTEKSTLVKERPFSVVPPQDQSGD